MKVVRTIWKNNTGNVKDIIRRIINRREETKSNPPKSHRSKRAKKLYCICQSTYSKDQSMVACDNCGLWYHYSCLCLKPVRKGDSFMEHVTFYCGINGCNSNKLVFKHRHDDNNTAADQTPDKSNDHTDNHNGDVGLTEDGNINETFSSREGEVKSDSRPESDDCGSNEETRVNEPASKLDSHSQSGDNLNTRDDVCSSRSSNSFLSDHDDSDNNFTTHIQSTDDKDN